MCPAQGQAQGSPLDTGPWEVRHEGKTERTQHSAVRAWPTSLGSFGTLLRGMEQLGPNVNRRESLSQLFTAAWSLADILTFQSLSPLSVVTGLQRCLMAILPVTTHQTHQEETKWAAFPSYNQPLAQVPGHSTMAAN